MKIEAQRLRCEVGEDEKWNVQFHISQLNSTREILGQVITGRIGIIQGRKCLKTNNKDELLLSVDWRKKSIKKKKKIHQFRLLSLTETFPHS